jgi:uncharacterized protein (TIGR00369 family)
MKEVDLSRCFGCGANNPVGLHLKNTYMGNRAHIEFVVGPEHNSYPGLMHGGLTCVLLDEVMYYATARLEAEAVTVSMNVSYRSPARLGDRLICEGWVDKREGGKIDVRATIINATTGTMVAEGAGRYVEVELEALVRANG